MKFEFNFGEEKEKLEEELTRPQMLRRKFCKYAGLDPKFTITEKDIKENLLGAFNRTAREEGCTNEELREALLN